MGERHPHVASHDSLANRYVQTRSATLMRLDIRGSTSEYVRVGNLVSRRFEGSGGNAFVSIATSLLPLDAIHFQPARTAMADDSYDYDANCRRWPDVAGPFPVGTVEFEVT